MRTSRIPGRWQAFGAAAVLVVTALVAQLAVTAPTGAVPDAPTAADRPERPSMVFILMDDFSMELLRTMPTLQRLKAAGASYTNSFVVDSLCCPSRSAVLTGQAPHQSGVLTNTPNDYAKPIGGWAAFKANGNVDKQFSVALQESGYTTGFVGKYINGYEAGRAADGSATPPPKVAGWSEWNVVLGGAYNGWGFNSTYLDQAGNVRLRWHRKFRRKASIATRDSTYSTNVTSNYALSFINRHKGDDQPYFLEIATYGPHAQQRPAYRQLASNFPPAFSDAIRVRKVRKYRKLRNGRRVRVVRTVRTPGNCGLRRCRALSVRDLPGYNDPRWDNAPTYLNEDGTTSPAPPWRTNPATMTQSNALRRYRDRARMVQSIDRLIARVRAAVGPDTYVVVSSDNGFHLGQHRLNGGKGTPYDSDTRVPLIVAGPGVVPGSRSQFVSNVDLAPTFEELAGARTGSFVTGRSFAGSLFDPTAPGAHAAFMEHTWARIQPGEVDADRGVGGAMDIIPSYIAVRSAQGLLARFDLDPSWSGTRYAYELYRYDVGWEDRNVFAEDHDKPYALDLMRRLVTWEDCEPDVCRLAAD